MIQRRAGLRFGGGGSSGQQRRGWNVKSEASSKWLDIPHVIEMVKLALDDRRVANSQMYIPVQEKL